jgi:hypothetical protein
MFVVSFNPDGVLSCAATLTSGGDNTNLDMNGICVDPWGNAFTGGDYEYTPFVVGGDTIGPGPLDTTGKGPERLFILKFDCGDVIPLVTWAGSLTLPASAPVIRP